MINKIVIKSDEGDYAPTNGARTIVLSSLSFTPIIEQLAYVFNKTQNILYYAPVQNLAKCTLSGVTITIDDSFPLLGGSDEIHIQFWIPLRAYDVNQDVNKVNIENPVWNRYTDAEEILAGTPYELTASFADVGSEIDVRGYGYVTLWVTVDIGTSTNIQLRLLHKHTSAGSEEYRDIYLGTPATNITTINLNDYEVNSDADQLFKITLPVIGTRYLQLQAKDDSNGDGQIDTLYVTKDWGV